MKLVKIQIFRNTTDNDHLQFHAVYRKRMEAQRHAGLKYVQIKQKGKMKAQ